MLCDSAPPSDQLAKTYRMPVPPAWGVVVIIVCWVPGVHWKVHGAVQGVPSTVSDRPYCTATVTHCWELLLFPMVSTTG